MAFPTISSVIVAVDAQFIPAFNKLIAQLVALTGYMNSKPQLDSILLQSVSLKQGNNSVLHTLGKTLTGWSIADATSSASIYRYAPSNNTTLFLNSSAPTTVSLVVF